MENVGFLLLLAQSSVLMLAGLAGFVAFLVLDVVLNDNVSPFLCVTVGILNGLMLHMHILNQRRSMAGFYPPLLLHTLSLVAAVILVVVLLTFVADLIIVGMGGFSTKNYYFAVLWMPMTGCVVVAVSAVLLMYFCHVYKRQGETARLLDDGAGGSRHSYGGAEM